MERVIVISCPGSGKSTFSKALHTLTGLPLFHLDMIYHRADRTTWAGFLRQTSGSWTGITRGPFRCGWPGAIRYSGWITLWRSAFRGSKPAGESPGATCHGSRRRKIRNFWNLSEASISRPDRRSGACLGTVPQSRWRFFSPGRWRRHFLIFSEQTFRKGQVISMHFKITNKIPAVESCGCNLL